jgi:hypothetical protein
MKIYEIIETPVTPVLKVTETDGQVWFVEIGGDSQRYAEYLRYTAWVEAGKKPEDFWAQNSDI